MDGSLMRKLAGVALALLLALAPVSRAGAVEAEDLRGAWKGQIEIPGMTLEILVEFTADGGPGGTIDIPAQKAENLALINFSLTADSVIFEIEGVPGDPTFHGAYAREPRRISGKFVQGGQSFPFSLTPLDEAKQAEETAAKAAALAEDLDSIRVYIARERERWKVPGIAVVIVHGDSVVLSDGYGYRNLADSAEVTENTLFAIGSSTKAFTTTMLGTLVDEGLLDWDEPVRTYLPEFEMWDEFATERMTARDLVTHRSGLPRHDLMWYNSSLTREELVSRLKYLEPNEDFRTTFQYQNLMFLTAGYLGEQLTGKSWEELVEERIFVPLGMTNSNFSVIESQQSDDFALPYQEIDDTIALMAFRDITTVGPAGSINSSVRDMAQWLRLQLNGGTVAGTEVINPATLADLHAPHMAMAATSSQEELPYSSYGMGWFVQPYRGHAQVHHGGNIDGFSALVAFFPNDELGVVVLTNKNGTPLTTFVTRYIADRFFDLDPIDWSERAKGQFDQMMAEGEKAQEATEETRIKGTKPSHKLDEYVGEYEHPAYGVVAIRLDDKQLVSEYNRLPATLEHWHYDVFRALFDDLDDQSMLVRFRTNEKGDIHELVAPLEPSVSEIVFTRRPDRRLSDPAFLKLLAGKYELATQTVRFELRGESTLVSILPGQPVYTLEPYQGTTFTLKGLTGFSVQFVGNEKDGFDEVKFIQPNGVFTGTRMSESESGE